jgi:hypothetical protein
MSIGEVENDVVREGDLSGWGTMRFTSREIIHDAMRCARQAYMIALALPVERMPNAKASMPKHAPPLPGQLELFATG